MCTFCVHCGRCAGTGPELVTGGVCPRCGHQNDTAASHCSECGSELPPLPGFATKEAIEEHMN